MSLLSAGICAWLNKASPSEIDELDTGYAVQLLAITKLNQTTRTPSTKERFRLVLSDGVHFVHALLATQLNDLVHLGEIAKYDIVVVDKVACVIVQDRRLVVVLGLHVISKDEGTKIGNPVVAPTPSAASTIHTGTGS